jgi:sodium-dependent dicarboxylate transporter 2/3/5
MLGIRIGFGQWMTVGVPVAAVMLPAAWLLLVYVLHPPGAVTGDAEAVLASEKAALGPVTRAERTVGIVFVLTALAWVFREPKQLGPATLPGIATFFPGVTDATIAMAAAMVLFVTPIDWRRGEFSLDWENARRIPWDVLVLFGGGLSLARAMERTGLATWIGGSVAELAGVPAWAVALAVAALFIFLTEVTSNTATSTMAMPVMAGAAVGIGTDPLILMGTAALSASMAFMLPVATPPNAIVFASGYLSIPQMGRAGFLLNLVAIGVVTLAATLLIPALLVR